MGQRLVRAKRKIRDAGIAFSMPEPASAPGRVGGVLSAIYAAFGTAWEDVNGADSKLAGLSGEAIWLGRLLRQLLPGDPEVAGLLALMLPLAKRDAARGVMGMAGSFRFSRQDTALWSRSMISEAEALLRAAARAHAPGRFQTEAAIQSLHAHQAMTGERSPDRSRSFTTCWPGSRRRRESWWRVPSLMPRTVIRHPRSASSTVWGIQPDISPGGRRGRGPAGWPERRKPPGRPPERPPGSAKIRACAASCCTAVSGTSANYFRIRHGGCRSPAVSPHMLAKIAEGMAAMIDAMVVRPRLPRWAWIVAGLGAAWNVFGIIQLIDFVTQTRASLMMKA